MLRPTIALSAGVLLLPVLPAGAQAPVAPQEPAFDSWKERGVVLGLNYGQYLFAEVGHYRSYVYRTGARPLYSTSLTYGAELSVRNGLVAAPKVQARLHILFANLSLAPVLYTDFHAVSLKLRPEIGFGLRHLDVNYGYNAGLLRNDWQKANRHLVSLRYYLLIRKRAHHEYDHRGQRVR